MEQQESDALIRLIQSEITPATGCTEPAAAALCAAAAAVQLGREPHSLTLEVSEYILKNAMNVGIPGTSEIGLDVAAAMGAVCARPERGLSVLADMTTEQLSRAKALCARTAISARADVPKVYIRTLACADGHTGEAVIQDAHTRIVRLARDGAAMGLDVQSVSTEEFADAPISHPKLSLPEIWTFAQEIAPVRLAFLSELVRLNSDISQEGLDHAYGLQVGLRMLRGTRIGLIAEDTANYAIAVTAAAADARMSGCEKAVMSVAGSGNQGLTATLPIIAVAHKAKLSEDMMLKSLAISILTTIHAKEYIGRLSVLCGCGVASAIGVTAGVVFLYGGTLQQAEMGVRTMTADISGMVCDGAKPGCALKIATSVSAAMRAATLALSDIGATEHDGIVSAGVEETLQNLGSLGSEGMAGANRAILDMLLHKQPLTPIAD